MRESIKTKSINNTETELASMEDPPSMYKTASNETSLISEIPNIINEENVINATTQGKNQFQF